MSVNAGGLYVKIPIKRNIYLYFIPRQLNGLDLSDAAAVSEQTKGTEVKECD